jgi:hypothetical protein
MKWIGDRISFADKKESVSFIIYPPNLGRKKGLLIAWMTLWVIIGAYVTTQFFKDYGDQEMIALFIFMSFWLYFAVRVGRTLLYLYLGREYIKLNKTGLRLKTATSQYGKSKQYFIENISKFTMVKMKENSIQRAFENSPWVKGTNRIQFEYQQKTYSFGLKLDEKDAKMMFQIITKRIEKYLKAKKKTV